ncbi:MAG TPA: hypothetical protein VFF06_06370 [Polyangia bacterium]|nr:hypothetical protein [Polyangia bacterium]
MRARGWLVIVLGLIAARAGAASPPAVAALQAGRFDDAAREAAAAIARNANDAPAHLVAALTRYKAAAHQLNLDVRGLAAGLDSRAVNLQYLRFSLGQFEKALLDTDAELAAAARDPKVSLELCLACWRIDWNGDGRIRSGDELLFQIEQDAAGQPLPDGDPRRKPTFRFDVGDIYWARAMLAFQHALVSAVLAYHWSDLDPWLARDEPKTKLLVIHLDDKSRIALARTRLLDGLAHADRARKEYLAETDDDREWVPNPRQKNHPMPLPVDENLYRTWEAVIGDVRRLVASQEGIALAELTRLADTDGPPPRGFLDLGKLLSDPKDLSFHVGDTKRVFDNPGQNAEAAARTLFGSVYVMNLKPSPLLQRLERMKKEMSRGEETLERKLRYFLWLN